MVNNCNHVTFFLSYYRFELFPENDLHDVVDVSLRLPVFDSLHDVGYIHFSIAVGIASLS